MREVFAGIITVLDVVALFVLLPVVKQRFLLAVWTSFLHMLFPIIGFQLGDWATSYLLDWGSWLSGILLFLIGLQILFSSSNSSELTLHPAILALSASIDSFSVSVSFGMLSLNKYLFVLTAGIGSFFLTYISLQIASKAHSFQSSPINIVSGLSLIILSIMTIIK